MMALTVRQPWAWMIIHAGKDIENRTWATRYRGPLLIHAGKGKPTRAEIEWVDQYARDRGVSIPWSQLEYGAVIGQVNLIGCTESHESTWWMGPVGWILADPRPLPPRPAKGQLGLFDVSSVSHDSRARTSS